MNSSEELSDKTVDPKKKVKFTARKKKDDTSSASSGDDDIDEIIDTTVSNSRNSNSSYSNIYRKYRKRHVWEVMEGYRDPNMVISQPENFEGILLKRRNWPMKGWHKRYFMLRDGILSYGKSKSDITKNKLHGTVNTFFSIVSYITSSRRILIDFSTQSNAFVCHLKAKTQADFETWIEHLKNHRRFYQYKFTQSTNNTSLQGVSRQSSVSIQNNSTQNSSITISNLPSLQKQANNELTSIFIPPQASSQGNIVNNVKSTILSDSELSDQFKLTEETLIHLANSLGLVTLSNQQTPRNSIVDQVQAPKNLTHHHQQASSVSFDYLQSKTNTQNNLHVSKSNPNLINNEYLVKNTNQIKKKSSKINNDENYSNGSRAVEITKPLENLTPTFLITCSTNSLSNNSTETDLEINSENNKLSFYQDAKLINNQLNFLYQQLLVKHQLILKAQKDVNLVDVDGTLTRDQRSQSVISSLSLQDSQLQFYDAIEDLTSESESDDSEDGSDDGASKSINAAVVPENLSSQVSYDSENIMVSEEELQAQKMKPWRDHLPAPAPDTSQVSVWGILRKAIGKDLSKIALPVILNEPISILQRLCEEIEYSELLDDANSKKDPFDRMVSVAAFIISGYASSYYRNGAKDFNPLLGETYELTHPGKGWKYVAEQVSHHPPVSATYCCSKTFIHEQIFHAKIKFWGRSMEVHPEGYTRLTLPNFDEIYQWNKIVMYISNLTGAQRRIEHNGEINIRCTNGVSCKITFPKANYSSQKNEFFGDVIFDNVVKRKIFGQWHETFMCGTDNTAKQVWRMGAMPEDASLYYGFTRFATHLNEFTDNLKEELPPTDSRFRPDQRLFENGKIDEAELEKQRIEESQRERRRKLETKNEIHQPLWFKQDKSNSNNKNEWEFNNQYWLQKDLPGFKNLKHKFPDLW